LNRARETATEFGIELIVVDQTKLHDELVNLIDTATGITGTPFSKGQMRSYQRTPVGYYVAQLFSQQGHPCVVMGTGNQDEDGYLCYFCKAGDGVVDIQLIADLHKYEVFQVGKALGVPSSTLEAAPSADLWADQTDEDELGFTYDFVELFTGAFLPLSEDQQKDFINSLSHDGQVFFEAASTACRKIHQRNKHKLSSPVNINILK